MPDSALRRFPAVDVGNGATRRVLSESPELMMVEVAFTSEGVGPEHSHPHVQSTFVQSGRFEFTVGGRSFEVGPGDAFVIPPRLSTAAAPSGCPAC